MSTAYENLIIANKVIDTVNFFKLQMYKMSVFCSTFIIMSDS
jgi:hypothetical protein